MIIRDEEFDDVGVIGSVTTSAFKDVPHSSQTEAFIISALRRSNALTVSLVAMQKGELVGHVAFSPVLIGGNEVGWYGLGPVAVRPDHQRQGIGAALVREGLARLDAMGADGCVVLGDPVFYNRFGFRSGTGLVLPGVPPEYFQALAFRDVPMAGGEVAYHQSFYAVE